MSRILIDLPEVIETPRLILQMPRAGFGKKLHEALTDGYEDYVKWLAFCNPVPTVEAVEEECRRHHADFILREYIRYIIIEKSTDEVVGRCSFAPLQTNWLIPQFGVGYFIRRNSRSKGYATEASHAMTLLAFKTLGALKVEIHCDVDNAASSRVPEKLNFKLEYTKKGGWPKQDGKLATIQVYSMFTEKDLPK